MTEKLKTLLHEQAETVDFAVPDLDSLTRTGDRRIRRRRATGLLGGVAALAVVGGLAVVTLPGGDGDDVRRDAPADTPSPTARVTWAEGSVLHWPGGSADLGHPIRAYLPTEVGYVFTDGAGAVYSAVDGQVTRVGAISAKQPRLVADRDGSRAAWVDPSGPRPQLAVLDQGTGETRFYTDSGFDSVTALDGDTVYGQAGGTATALDLASGTTSPVDVPSVAEVMAAEDGVIISDTGDGDGGADGDLVRRPDGTVVTLHQAYSSSATFSPDARWVSIDADEPRVFDSTSGQQVSFDVDGRVFATGYEWLAPDTIVMIASRNENGPVELLTCTVPAGTCESTVPDLGTFTDLAARFALPVGVELED
jgi:hypothetical protein